ncbi:MAG: hypothetical protein V1694_07975 [Candidatus Eisenbacteria bacterium]
MELSTFGAILKFAMDQEKDIGDIVRSAGSNEGGTRELSPFRELTDRIVSDSKRTGDLLERTRRQGINEVILHAVTGIDSDNYRVEPLPAGELTAREFGEYLAGTFGRIAAFYGDAASRVSNPEAARIFNRLATQRLKLRDDIKEYLSSLK